MQKYILGADPHDQCALIRPFNDKGETTGDWRRFNAGIVYLVSDVDTRIAELEKALREAMEWNWLDDEDSPPPQEVVDQCNSALMESVTK